MCETLIGKVRTFHCIKLEYFSDQKQVIVSEQRKKIIF